MIANVGEYISEDHASGTDKQIAEYQSYLCGHP
jgi:hypothetical protein